LDQKFKLFKGVFGASDEVLGTIESGVDFEKRIARIYQTCRTVEEINQAFDTLQKEMDESIQSNLSDTRQKLLENFDTEVHEKLKINERESLAYLDAYERRLWEVTRYYLGNNADFAEHEYSFTLKNNPFPNEDIDSGPYKIGKGVADAHVYRPGHPLAQRIFSEIKAKQSAEAEIVFDYSHNDAIISVLAPLIGKSGALKVTSYTIEAFEAEDAIVISAVDEKEEAIDPEIIKKIFSLSAVSMTPRQVTPELHKKLDGLEQRFVSTLFAQIAERNGRFFDDEIDKLDNWSEDKRRSLKILLKEYDDQIMALKKEGRSALNLPEKLTAQKKIRDLDAKRNAAWKQYDEAAKTIEQQKDGLLDTVEKRLKQKIEKKTLFTIGWRII
jgi:hypothetical protein